MEVLTNQNLALIIKDLKYKKIPQRNNCQFRIYYPELISVLEHEFLHNEAREEKLKSEKEKYETPEKELKFKSAKKLFF